jgi:uncharacterized protein
MPEIEITIGNIVVVVECRETPTAKAIIESLPFNSTAQTWGKEVYFSAPVHVSKEADAKDVINAGEIAFWVEGSCIAIGFGPTPISIAEEIRLAAETNIWGHSQDDLDILSKVNQGDPISLKLLD